MSGMTIQLQQCPVAMVKGVSALKEKELHAFGIFTVADLLDYFPFRYEDFCLRRLSEVEDGDKVTVRGRVMGVPVLQRYGGKSRLSCKVMADEDCLVTATWFNRHYLRTELTNHREIVITGKWDKHRMRLTVSVSEFPDRGERYTDTLQPVYSLKGDITQTWLRKTIVQALQQFGAAVPEIVPADLMQRHQLIPRQQAVRALHIPHGVEEGMQARRRIVYEELFLFQLRLHVLRTTMRERADGAQLTGVNASVREFVRQLPFELTEGQKQAVTDILHDMRSSSCMNRLLQGDVGSGKTVVAAIALYVAVQAGYQGAWMVPTEILAEQHFRMLQQLFEPHGKEVALLTGSLTQRQQRDVRGALQMGFIHVVVGTQALIQDDVHYRKLGLVVIDEQHRFGVNQRSHLRRKGWNPDVLMMTATPIPRTLAITAFGDLDVSSIRERPTGREAPTTYWFKPDKFALLPDYIRREVVKGRQVYVICPLIEESDKVDLQNAIDVHVQLRQALPDLHLDLLHGRMPAAQKNEVMRSFHSGETHVLISTTVIEVGVDVPNATLMIVMDAERFGLSQLHQLRGRVGRGGHPSTCILIADPKSEVGQERMRIMMETGNGFELAQRDLELRGPGEFFGTKQSGLPEFKWADMTHDFAVLEQAREDALALLRSATFWTSPEYQSLRDVLHGEERFQAEVLD